MKHSNEILNFIKTKTIYELKRSADIFRSFFIGLIVAFVILFIELIKLLFNYLNSKMLSSVPDIPNFIIGSQILVLCLLGILIVILLKIYSSKVLYLSLKERRIDKIENKKDAIRKIEEELEELETI